MRDADRETALLQHRSAFGERLGLDPAFVRRIFREILDDSVRRQQDALQTSAADAEQEMRVAFQGTEGAYGHQAALQHFAVTQRPVGFKAYGTFKEMLEAVIEGHADRAMLPIENTTAGSVYESYDLLLRFNLSLVGEEIVDVRHCLLGVADVPIESLRRIHSHPQALSQCSEFLSTLPRLRGRQRREHRAGGEARARSERSRPKPRSPARKPARISACTSCSATSPTSR